MSHMRHVVVYRICPEIQSHSGASEDLFGVLLVGMNLHGGAWIEILFQAKIQLVNRLREP